MENQTAENNLREKVTITERNASTSSKNEVETEELVDNYKIFQIFLLGDVQVGKTSVLQQYTKESFSEYPRKTIVIDHKAKIMNKHLLLSLWETSGQVAYKSKTSSFYKRADGFLLMYDISNKKSFKQIKFWLKIAIENCHENVALLLCGNKYDKESFRQVSTEEAEQFATEIGALFFETSAKTGHNVKGAFKSLVNQIRSKKFSNSETSTNKDKEEA